MNSQRDPPLSENQSAGQEAPVRSSLQMAARNPATMKPLKNTRAGEWPQQSDEENEDLGLLVPLGEVCARNRAVA